MWLTAGAKLGDAALNCLTHSIDLELIHLSSRFHQDAGLLFRLAFKWQEKKCSLLFSKCCYWAQFQNTLTDSKLWGQVRLFGTLQFKWIPNNYKLTFNAISSLRFWFIWIRQIITQVVLQPLSEPRNRSEVCCCRSFGIKNPLINLNKHHSSRNTYSFIAGGECSHGSARGKGPRQLPDNALSPAGVSCSWFDWCALYS